MPPVGKYPRNAPKGKYFGRPPKTEFKKRKYYPDKRENRIRSLPKERQALKGRKGSFVIAEQLVEKVEHYLPELIKQTQETALGPGGNSAGGKELNGSEILAHRATVYSNRRDYRSTVRRWYAVRSGETFLTDLSFADELLLGCDDPAALADLHVFPCSWDLAVEMADAYLEGQNGNAEGVDKEELAREMMLIAHAIAEHKTDLICSEHCLGAIGGGESTWLTTGPR